MSVEVKYIETRGKWALWVDGVFLKYVEEEMVKKIDFATKVQANTTSIAGLKDTLEDVVEVFFARGYNAGGADPITDADLAGTGITLADLTACITMFQQIANFFGNQAVTQGDYSTTVNKMRTDI